MTTTIDVVQDEIVPAYVQNGREEDGNTFDVTLRRSYGGGKANKSTDYIGFLLLVRLNKIPDGRVHIGERSSPAEISAEFPGVSKRDFKKAIGGLSKQRLVRLGKHVVELLLKPPTNYYSVREYPMTLPRYLLTD